MSKPVPRLAAYVSDIQTLEEGDVAPRTAANADKVLKPLPSDRVGMGTKTFIAKASDRGLLDKSPQAVGLRGRFPLQNRLRSDPKGMVTVPAMQPFSILRRRKPSFSARKTNSWKVAALLLGFVLVGSGVGCGLGSYDDLGEPVPGDRWPWVCPDGSEPSSDGGCPSTASTDAATADDASDAAAEGAL